jgi:hypothetical protein
VGTTDYRWGEGNVEAFVEETHHGVDGVSAVVWPSPVGFDETTIAFHVFVRSLFCWVEWDSLTVSVTTLYYRFLVIYLSLTVFDFLDHHHNNRLRK